VNSVNVTSCVVVNTTHVVIKRLWDSDRAREWTALEQLIHHGLFSVYMAEFVDTVGVVLRRDVASLSRLTVAAEGHRAATNTVVPSPCLVNRASLISNIVFVNPLVRVVSVSSVATIVFLLTGDQNLRSDVNIGPGCLALNFYSIGESRSCSLGPA
jgi:hypothetical protein